MIPLLPDLVYRSTERLYIVSVDICEGTKAMRHATSWVFLALGLIVLLSFSHYAGIKFASNDDITIYTVVREYGLLQTGWGVAKAQGRFFLLFTLPITHFPYLIAHPYFYHAVHFLGFGLVLLLCFLTAQEFSQSRLHGIFTTLVFATLLQNYLDHGTLTSYPLVFQVGVSLILGAIYYLVRFQRLGHRRDRVLSIAMFSYGILFYEFCSLYGVILAGCIAYTSFQSHRLWSDRIASFARVIWPYFAVVVVYAGVSIVFRSVYETAYVGNMVAENLTVSGYVRALFTFVYSSIPGALYFEPGYTQFFQHYNSSGIGHPTGALSWLAQMRIEWAVKAVLVFSVSYWATRENPVHISGRAYVAGAALALLALVIPYVLPSLSQKFFPKVIFAGWKNYTFSFYAFFGVVGFLILTWAFLGSRIARRPQLVPWWSALVSLALAIVGLNVDYSNHYTAGMQRLHYQKWKLVDSYLHSDLFPTPDTPCVLFAPTLEVPPYSKYYVTSHFKWSSYIKASTGRTCERLPELADAKQSLEEGTEVRWLHFASTARIPDQFLAVAKIVEFQTHPDETTSMVADRVSVFGPPLRRFWVQFESTDTAPTDLMVGGRSHTMSGGAVRIRARARQHRDGSARVELEVPGLILGSFMISTFEPIELYGIADSDR